MMPGIVGLHATDYLIDLSLPLQASLVFLLLQALMGGTVTHLSRLR